MVPRKKNEKGQYGFLGSAIPDTWDEFELSRRFRGIVYHISVVSPDRVCSGVKEMTVNGVKVPGNEIIFNEKD